MSKLKLVPKASLRDWARAEVAKYRARKVHGHQAGIEGTIMRELTPPIQSDAERGQGESTNAMMTRLLRGKQ